MNRREAAEADRREAVRLIADLAHAADGDGDEIEAGIELSNFVQRLFGITAAEIDAEREV